jgi:hypothetical protein
VNAQTGEFGFHLVPTTVNEWHTYALVDYGPQVYASEPRVLAFLDSVDRQRLLQQLAASFQDDGSPCQ